MATVSPAQFVVRHPHRRLDVQAIVSELLRHEEEAEDLALEESSFRQLIEAGGMIGYDAEMGTFA